jgi:hypothetical protein
MRNILKLQFNENAFPAVVAERRQFFWNPTNLPYPQSGAAILDRSPQSDPRKSKD